MTYLILVCEALSSWLKLDDCLWLDPPWFNQWFSLALTRSVGIYSHEPFSLFHPYKCFYDDALNELVNHYANRTLIVSCTKDYTLIYGKGLGTVKDP